MGFCKHGDYEYCVWCDRDRLRAELEKAQAKTKDHDSAAQAHKERADFLEQENAKLRRALRSIMDGGPARSIAWLALGKERE